VLNAVRDYFDRLNRSLAACYRLLKRPQAAQRAIGGLLTIHTALLAYSAYVHSPTLNEPGHLVAGLSIWKFGRFDVYNVNPPLVKMVAALPVMAAGYEDDWSGFYTGAGARPEFAMGEDFVAANGERSFFLFMIARWACIPFSWLGGMVCYLWARDLFGRPSGVVACAIWCFEPNILANASLITPDAHATALGLAACYTFWRWLKAPTWSQAALTGAVLGLAELAKTTLILFYPLWPVMWVIYRWPNRKAMVARDWLREGGMLALRIAIGLYVLNLGYWAEGALRPMGEFRFVSELFTGRKSDDQKLETGVTANSNEAAVSDPQSPDLPRNRFARTWLASIPSPVPQNYLLGIDMQQRDFENYGRPSYLRGEWRDHGWWYYYLYACAIKVPLGLWAIGVLGLSALVVRGFGIRSSGPRNDRYGGSKQATSCESPVSAPQSSEDDSSRDMFILLLPPLVIFAIVSLKTGFNEHLRYVLPSFPFVYIGISGLVTNFLDNANPTGVAYRGFGQTPLRRSAAPLFLTLLFWSSVSSCWIYPHSLSYFSEAIGGPLNGPTHLLGSNVDWGQDYLYLQTWLNNHAADDTIYLAFHSNFDPARVGFARARPWPVRLAFADDDAAKNIGADGGIDCYAASVNLLWGTDMAARDGARASNEVPVLAYAQAKSREPAGRAGYSIRVFR
jgi:hypothetical protein